MDKSVNGKDAAQMLSTFEDYAKGRLEAYLVQAAHSVISMGGISMPQVQASMDRFCSNPNVCEKWEFIDLLKEMDRRYYLVQKFKWEFSLLDQHSTHTISEKQARWFMQSVHGQYFCHKRWCRFIKSRPAPSADISFPEIEVELCNIYGPEMKEEKRNDRDEAEKLKEGNAQRLEKERERTRLDQEEEERKRLEDEEMLKKLNRKEEERNKREKKKARDMEVVAQEAAKAKEIAKREAKEAEEKPKLAEDAKTKKEMEDLQNVAQMRQKDAEEKIIRANLKVSISSRNTELIKKSLEDFKRAKLKDRDGDISKAEEIVRLMAAKKGLLKVMAMRNIDRLVVAMDEIRKRGHATKLPKEMLEANQLLLRLERLARLRADILKLEQPTSAEIRSYQIPPKIIHSVMIGTLLLLGHKKKECKKWKKVQALIGKTGKENLIRRCVNYDPSSLAKNLELAERVKSMFELFEMNDVREVSAGAATFYRWAMGMIEEAESIASQVEAD